MSRVAGNDEVWAITEYGDFRTIFNIFAVPRSGTMRQCNVVVCSCLDLVDLIQESILVRRKSN